MPKHIKRLIILIAVFGALAWVGKTWLTDKSFYEFGHYRGDSVMEVAAHEPAYRTSSYCGACHAERVAQWSASNHKTVICEVCHGAAKDHPASGKLPIPRDTRALCTLCHEAMAGRPRSHPQIDVAAHTGGQQCAACHNPHAPKIVAATARVAGDAAAGRKRAESCAGCHGAQGVSSNDTWPSLAGQSAIYLARILGAYKSGAEKDVMMTPISQELSDADVQNLAAYYAGLRCAPAEGARPTGDPAAGKSLAKNCASCHGETGIAANPAWPSLAGQQPGYLMNVLKAFRAGLRKDPTMASVTRGLSDKDVADLAAFYAGQACEQQRQARGTP